MISVIIPVYNTEQYLPRCIDSVLASAYQEFEILLVNDGSTDHSPDICRQYAEKDSRIRLIDQKNQGVSAARNRGIDASTGDWIVFLDSDDRISPDFLRMVAQEEYQELDFLLFDFIRSAQGTLSAGHPPETIRYTADTMQQLIRRILVPQPLTPDGSTDFRTPCARAYKRSVLNRYSIRFSPDLSIGEDLLFNLEYQLRAASAAYLSSPVYFYDIHMGSSSRRYHPGLQTNHASLQRFIKTALENCGMFSALEDDFYSYALENLSYVLIRDIFSPLNPKTCLKKRRLCSEMRKNEIYRQAMKYNRKSGILPRRILVFFFRIRCYFITGLISRISYWYLGRKEFS